MLAGDDLATPSSRLFLGLVPWYGILIVLGAALAIVLSEKEARRQSLPKDTILDLSLWLLPFGIAGARLYYVIFSLPSYQANPVSVLYIWEGGLAIYGGLLAGIVVIVLFCIRKKISVPLMLDILSPGVVLAQGIGRWGNYFNQEAYGLPLSPSSPFCFFPLAVKIQNPDGAVWHMAAFFYESVLDISICFFLLFARRKMIRKKGDVFLSYAFFYAAGRLVIENFRMDSLYLGTEIRISQLLSVAFCMFLLCSLFIRRRKEMRAIRPIHIIMSVFSFLSGICVLYYSLHNSFFSSASTVFQVAVLCSFSIPAAFTVLILYGRSSEKELIYADNQI